MRILALPEVPCVSDLKPAITAERCPEPPQPADKVLFSGTKSEGHLGWSSARSFVRPLGGVAVR
jgi:hypothetical protein